MNNLHERKAEELSLLSLSRPRSLTGFARKLERTFLLGIPSIGIAYIFDLPRRLGIYLYTEQYLGIFLGIFLAATFLTVPAWKRAKRESVPWYDWILLVLSILSGIYLTVCYPDIAVALGQPDFPRLLFGGITILLILEAARREVGLSLFITVSAILIYGRFAYHFPAFLGGRPMSFEHMINYLYTDPNSMLWMISIAATLGIAFTIFGQVLIHFGAGEIFVDLAMLVCGRMRGGTAKTTVVSSSLFGTISGGAVSNVLVDGFITIPMMIKSGYKPAVAAATEAVSSTGGQIMPPVMGIGAFVMAEYLGVPYAKVAIAAIIPALLYYFAVYTQLDIDAAKLGIKALSRDQIPPLARTIKHSWSFILTISLLVYTLFIKRLDASVAATITGLLSVPILVVASKNRRGCFRLFINSLEGSGRLLLTIGTVMALAGIVVGIVNISGLGFSISYLITQVGKFNIMFLLLGTAAASMILGMGMPTVAAYALAATVCATAMIKSGIDPMATHMFIFYFAVISNITPPIALAIFAAAPIAGAPIMKTGYIAMRLAIMSYIVPFLFVFSPSLLLKGPLVHIVISVVTATVGVYFLCVALTGFLIQGISWLRRIVIGVGALALLLPTRQDIFTLTVVINAVGLLILFITIQPEIRFLFTKSRPNPNKLATLDQKELTEPK